MEGVVAIPLSGWSGRVLTVGVDSGAAATVVPASQFAEYPLVPNAMGESGRVYYTANGGKVRDLGTRSLIGKIGGRRRGLRASAADVSKALVSVADMVDQGNVVVFSKDRSFAYHPKAKEKIEFLRRNKVYEFDIEVDQYVSGGAGRSVFPGRLRRKTDSATRAARGQRGGRGRG